MNDSSASEDRTKETNATAGDLIEQLRGWVPGKDASDCAVDWTPEAVLAWLKKNHAYAYVMCRPLSFTVEEIGRIINAFNNMAPAEVPDKHEDSTENTGTDAGDCRINPENFKRSWNQAVHEAAPLLDRWSLQTPAVTSDNRQDTKVADEEKPYILESTRLSDENKATSEYLRDMIGS